MDTAPIWAVDLALAAVAVEVIALVVYRQAQGRGLRLPDIAGQLLAGAILLLALRTAWMGVDPLWTLALLGASLPAHVFDLLRRARAADTKTSLTS